MVFIIKKCTLTCVNRSYRHGSGSRLDAVYKATASEIGHFRVPLCLCFKASLSVKMTLICMKMKLHAELIFIRKVSHLDSF